MKPANPVGRRTALLLMGSDSAGADDWAVLLGSIVEEEGRLVFVHAQGSLELSDEWASRIRPTTGEVASILGEAEYVLTLLVGRVTNEEAASLRKTGLRWPG